MRIGSREFETDKKTYCMGILNVTPDSFSDGGSWNSVDKALSHVEEMIARGMDILDIGGESTRPGFAEVTASEELKRVIPVIRAVRERFDIPISLDTYKAEVAEEGIQAGADLINDIWGLKKDPEMAGMIARGGVACCLMHNRLQTGYGNLTEDMKADLRKTLEIARKAGIADDKIILDPGVGFGKTYEDNLEVLAKLQDFHSLGFPLLLGASRKSVIGLTLNLPADEREEGTLVTTTLAVMAGYGFVRVHDVEKNVRAIRMAEAIRERRAL